MEAIDICLVYIFTMFVLEGFWQFLWRLYERQLGNVFLALYSIVLFTTTIWRLTVGHDGFLNTTTTPDILGLIFLIIVLFLIFHFSIKFVFLFFTFFLPLKRKNNSRLQKTRNQ